MTLLNTINVGGTNFKVAGVAILGSCPTPAGSEVKVCTFTDDFELKAGDMLLVKFTYANTYGDGSTTYPKLQVNGTNYTMRRADGSYITAGEWDNNATLTFLFDGTDFILPAGSGSEKGSGVPLGTILAIHSNQVPDGYLPCNGVQFDNTQFAALYALLGDDHTPDLRECVLVGSGQSERTVLDESGHSHDVYTVGQFKDDQLQDHAHSTEMSSPDGTGGASWGLVQEQKNNFVNTIGVINARTGTTTHGKQVGVNYIIKATSGLPDDQQDYILGTMNTQRSYFTSEIDTGKKWIDGKAIYRKVLTTTSAINTDTFYWGGLETEVQNMNISSVISVSGVDNTYGKTFRPMGFSSTAGFSVLSTGLAQGANIIIEYTKTTPST